MTVDLFAGVPVRDLAVATSWYERLLGSPPAFLPSDTEAVWEVVRKVIFRDPDGTEIGFGGGSA